MTAVIFSFEGVLQSDGGRPIEAGCRLYRTLRTGLLYQVFIVSAAEGATVRRFLDYQLMTAPTMLQGSVPPSPRDWVLACNVLRRQPFEIDFVVTPQPGIASALYYEGFRAILWTDPRYSRPEWRPDAPPYQASPWHQFAAEVTEERELAAGDQRASRE